MFLMKYSIMLKGLHLQGASEGFECDEKASILCLAPGYSTFDLPFMHQQNFIKIGEEADMKVFLEPYNLYIVSLRGAKKFTLPKDITTICTRKHYTQ